MSLIKFALQHTKLAHVLFIMLSAIGIVAWMGLPIEVYPELRTSSAVALTVWPGATAEQVERLVTSKIESQIEGLRHVSWHRSESTANLSRIVVRFDGRASKSEVDSAFAALQSRVNQTADLPEGCEPPTVSRFKLDEDTPFLRLCVIDTRQRGPLAVRRAARELKRELGDVPGVAQVQLLGAGEPEVKVLVDRDKMEDAGLSLVQLVGVLRRGAVSLPVGSVATGAEDYPVRFVGDLEQWEQLGETIVRKDPAGAHVYLKDIARLEKGLAQDFVRARYQGQRCIVAEITKTSGTNIIHVRDRVMRLLKDYRNRESESGITIAVPVDITPWVTNALSVMEQNLLAGCVLVLLVLGISLGVRNSILAMLGIPFSFLCTLICMQGLGITVNTASVFALVLVSGMIVDDAIVVLENSYRHIQAGLPRREAIVRGAGEVLAPVCAAALTTVAAFLPILVARTGIGSLFADVPKLIAIALLSSLFECVFILPSHLLHWGPRGRRGRSGAPGHDARRGEGDGLLSRLGGWVSRAYLAVLAPLLRLRYLAALLLAAIVLLAVSAVGLIRVEALPAEFPMALINFETAPEASLDTTDRVGAELGSWLKELTGEDKVVKNSLAVAGMQLTEHEELVRQTNVGMIWVQFQPSTTARRDPAALLEVLRRRIEQGRREHPDLGLAAFSVLPMGTGLETRAAVAIRVEHEDLNTCRVVADHIRQRLAEIPGVAQIRDNMREGPLELSLAPVEPDCSEFGLTFLDVASAVRAAMYGAAAGSLRQPDTDEELPIRVLFDRPYRDSIDDLLAVPLNTPTGAAPRVREVANLYYQQHYASLYHYNGRRLITVGATIPVATVDALGRPIDIRYVNQTIAREFESLQQQYPGLELSIGGSYAQRQETFGDLALAGCLAIGLIYLALLAQFRSYIQPLLVLLTLIFGFAGVVLGLGVHGYAFSVVTAVSLVGLFGVAVNDGIILIDFINKSRLAGLERFEGVVEACRLRLRPIVVTTVTTVAGLLPMALGFRGYSSIWSPFAACFCYGLSAATLLTLLIMPCFYLICDDVSRLGQRLLGGHREDV